MKLHILGLRVMTNWLTYDFVRVGYLFKEPLFLWLGHVGGIPFGESGSSVSTDKEKAMDHKTLILS